MLNKTLHEDRLFNECISNLFPFKPDQLRYLRTYFYKIACDTDELIAEQSTVHHSFYFVAEGCMRMHSDFEGKNATICLINKFDAITDFISYKEGKPSYYNLSATVPSTVYAISYTDLHLLYEEHEDFERFGRRMLEQIYANGTKRLHEYLFNTPEQNYQRLMKLSPELIAKVAQKYIASYLNITPQSLSRIKRRIFKG